MMGTDDGSNHAEAKTMTAFGAAGVKPDQPFEYLLQILGRYAGTSIGQNENRLPILLSQRQCRT